MRNVGCVESIVGRLGRRVSKARTETSCDGGRLKKKKRTKNKKNEKNSRARHENRSASREVANARIIENPTRLDSPSFAARGTWRASAIGTRIPAAVWSTWRSISRERTSAIFVSTKSIAPSFQVGSSVHGKFQGFTIRISRCSARSIDELSLPPSLSLSLSLSLYLSMCLTSLSNISRNISLVVTGKFRSLR